MDVQRRYFGYSSEKWMKLTDKERKQAAEDYENDRKKKRFGEKWGMKPLQEEKV